MGEENNNHETLNYSLTDTSSFHHIVAVFSTSGKLYVDGIENAAISQNSTHFIFEVWLIEGVHSLQLIACDDIDQTTTLVLPSINVVLDKNTNTTSNNWTFITTTGMNDTSMNKSRRKGSTKK